MIRWGLFALLSAALVGWAFWIYLRVELSVPGARVLATLRALALVIIAALLLDLRLPGGDSGASDERWVLLDASLSMTAASAGGATAWEAAAERAEELEDDGWRVVTFGGAAGTDAPEGAPGPEETTSLLAPALRRAAEAGVRSIRVLSDLRLEDQVEVRAALASLPLEVAFERFGEEEVVNAGVSELDVPDLVRSEGSVTATVEVHSSGADSVTVRVLEEDREVAQVTVPAPSPGLRTRVPIELPTPAASGRVRYSATASVPDDAFPSDDQAVRHAAVGHQEGALVVVSLQPDWEPRYLLPVLQEVTGLPGIGYLKAGSDAFVPMGRAVDRGAPVDSATVRLAASDAALLVLHGLGSDAAPWVRALAGRTGRAVLIPADAEGASLAGIPSGEPQGGEWYASADVPTSPVAGSLAGASLQGLPPLSNVLLPDDPARVRGALLVQLRGAGSPEAAIHLEDRGEGRTAVVLAGGLWRWAAREGGREAYRRVWSGVAGWLLADQSPNASEVRPTTWVVTRGEPVSWNVPADTAESRLLVISVDSVEAGRADSVVVDVLLEGAGPVSTGVLPPGPYRYRAASPDGDIVSEGRFDVAAATAEMVPVPEEPVPSAGQASAVTSAEPPGTPLRTRPWPYLLVMGLLCGEWIGRRRRGLR